MLTTAKDAPKHVAAVLKNVEGWLSNLESFPFFGFIGTIIIIIILLVLPPPPPRPFRQMC